MAAFQNNPYLLVFGGLVIVNSLVLMILVWRFLVYQKKQKELAVDKDGTLADVVLKNKKTLAVHGKNLKELGKILVELIEQNRLNVQKVGVVRFNPFADAGGNLSFAIALLDGQNNGIVLSSLHGREGTRIYAKTIENGGSKYNLTDEEKEAIQQAQKNKSS
jgi:hypothetical protein